jgi:hypothetical protein
MRAWLDWSGVPAVLPDRRVLQDPRPVVVAEDGGPQLAPAVHADLVEDGLEVVVNGDRCSVLAISVVERPWMTRRVTARSRGVRP